MRVAAVLAGLLAAAPLPFGLALGPSALLAGDAGIAISESARIQGAEARRLVDWFDRKYDGEVNAYLLHEKLEKRAQGLGSPDPAALRAGRDHLRWHLDYMAWLLESRDGLAGPRYTLADIAAAAHLSCADYLGDVPWDAFEPVKHWYQRVKCRPAFRGLLTDKLPGTPPSAHYADLDF